MEPQAPASAQSRAILIPRSMLVFTPLYGGLVVLACAAMLALAPETRGRALEVSAD